MIAPGKAGHNIKTATRQTFHLKYDEGAEVDPFRDKHSMIEISNDVIVPTPKKPRKRGPKLRENERHVRAEMILVRKLCGAKMRDIAKEFNIDVSTAKRALQLARQQNYYDKAKDILSTRLIPKSLAVYDAALESGDLELAVTVAREVLRGSGILSDKVDHRILPPGTEESYEVWRERYIKRTNETGGGSVIEVSSTTVCDGGVEGGQQERQKALGEGSSEGGEEIEGL